MLSTTFNNGKDIGFIGSKRKPRRPHGDQRLVLLIMGGSNETFPAHFVVFVFLLSMQQYFIGKGV